MGSPCDFGPANTRVDFLAYPGAIGMQFVKEAAGGLPARYHETPGAHLREQPAGDFAKVFDDHRRRIPAGGFLHQIADPPPLLRAVRKVRAQRGYDRVPSV